ncbi:GtrA family protein [Burkholderia sp. Bp8963]|uniref:GtrA family protein n=1 Tax=Burkholderia sp. Bp8963 TaxID=2184547 RepID=UPI000F5B3A7D|nr:GtrA family protein [Burkholderia sp. Bp8963]RQS69527.1 GtrA family protein [Burkholderia sp. Bp8963]
MIRSLYAAERARLFRFGVSGICSTAIHTLVASAMFALLDASPVTANAVAFVVATVFSYLANTLWSFSSTVQWSNLLRFLLVAVSGLVETMLLARGTEALGLAPGWSIVAVVLFVPPVTFVLHRLWTYREAGTDDA